VLVLVKAWLERKERGRLLMVIDNADDIQLFFGQHNRLANAGSSSYEKSLGQYLPECSHGAILVTTRNKQTGSRLAKGNRPVEVGRMDEDETAQLLRARLGGIDAASDESAALSSRLEHLPLALVQAAAFIQENTITISHYLRLLDEREQNVIDLLSEEFETDGRDSETPRAVAETWILSLDQIQRQNIFAGELLSLMSLFDRQAIPVEFLSRYSKQQGQEQRGEIQLTKALGVLKAFCFVVEDKDGRFDMHRLVQLVTQRWLDRKRTMDRFAEQALSVVSQAYPYGHYENRAICSALLPHVYAVLRLVSTGSKDERLARASLLHCVAGFFSYRGQWNEAERFQLQARGLRREVLREEHHDTLSSMADLASTYANQGRWKEAELLEVQVMETRKRVLGSEHPDTLSSMANLAATYRNQGRWKEAESLEVQVMETGKRVLGSEHPDTLSSMANLASTYANQGRWKEADRLYVQVMETRKTKMFVQVMETCKTKLGAYHPDTLTSMVNLASRYRKQGRWEEVESLEVQVMEARKRVLGEEHPSTLTSMANLAHTWKSQDRLEDALDLMKTCFHQQQQVLGRDHPDTVSTLSILTEWQGT
jgi:tetratricopeptide (TPR) repeat protein